MDVIIVCHTEFGYVVDKETVFDKDKHEGVEEGVPNLINIADKYKARITFTVMPEVVGQFPTKIEHEIGLHIHPGWEERKYHGFKWIRGDQYLRETCRQSLSSSLLRAYPYQEQLDMIKRGKEHLQDKLKVDPRVFVAGRWSENNDTIKAVIEAGFTHDCTPPAHQKAKHFDWSKLPRISMPYHPSDNDYQQKGDLPLLIVPVSQCFPRGSVSPETAPIVGLLWLKACFLEYYRQGLSLFHIYLHSNSMVDPYFLSVMDELLDFIAEYDDITFKFASEIKEYSDVNPKTNIVPYLRAVNKDIMRTVFKQKICRLRG